MTPEIRLEAIKIAHALHTDIDKVIESAGRLVSFISGNASDEPKPAAARAAKAKPATPESVQSEATPPAATGTPPAQSAAAQQTAAPIKQSVASLVYEDVKKLILKLTPVNRSAAMKILQDHGVAKGPDLKPEQYDSAHKALTEALAAHEAAKVA